MSFVDARTKVVAVAAASRSLRSALQGRAAWDPLRLEKGLGRALLLFLKRSDPLNLGMEGARRTKRAPPPGFFEVHQLECELMDSEHDPLDDPDTSDTEITNPILEFCGCLRCCFGEVRELSISSIDVVTMDYWFVWLRVWELAEYGFVEFVHNATARPSCSLLARRDDPPRRVDCEAALVENRARMPPDCRPDERMSISECEALYLMEHRSAYKNGNDFYRVGRRTLSSSDVRKHYKALVSVLRKRFPEQFS